jgi:hypothetical protein
MPASVLTTRTTRLFQNALCSVKPSA